MLQFSDSVHFHITQSFVYFCLLFQIEELLSTFLLRQIWCWWSPSVFVYFVLFCFVFVCKSLDHVDRVFFNDSFYLLIFENVLHFPLACRASTEKSLEWFLCIYKSPFFPWLPLNSLSWTSESVLLAQWTHYIQFLPQVWEVFCYYFFR